MTDKKEESFILKYKKEILIGFIAFLMLVFIVQNAEEIQFQIIFIDMKISLIFLITLFYGMGLLTMFIRYHSVLKEKNKKIKELEKQVKEEANKTIPPSIP